MIITWDDSDGWYDHAFAHRPQRLSTPTADQLERARQVRHAAQPPPTACRQAGEWPLRSRHAHAVPGHLALGQAELCRATTRISQASVVRFIEDNWLHGERLGGGSFDATAGSIMDMFDFSVGFRGIPRAVLDPTTGTPLCGAAGARTDRHASWLAAATRCRPLCAPALLMPAGAVPSRPNRNILPTAKIRIRCGSSVRRAAPLSAMAQLGRQIFFDPACPRRAGFPARPATARSMPTARRTTRR